MHFFKLNSQVTIHNISESKFHRDHQQSPLTNGVEITRIAGPVQQQPQPGFSGNLAVGSQRQSAGRSGEPIAEFSGTYTFKLFLNLK